MYIGFRSLEQFEKGSQDSLFIVMGEILHFLRGEESFFTGEITEEGLEYDLLRIGYDIIIHNATQDYMSMILDFQISKVLKSKPALTDEILLKLLIVKHVCKSLLSRNWQSFDEIAWYACKAETMYTLRRNPELVNPE